MQYQKLLNRTFNLIRHTQKEWQEVVDKEDKSEIAINDFVLPMAGLCALAAFLGILFQGAGFEKALVSAIISLGKSFGGVYLSFFVLQESASYFELERNKTRFLQLASYSFVIIFVIDIVVKLIPELFFLPILQLYIFYIIWEASDVLIKVKESKRSQFVIAASILILFSSFIIEKILLLFMPGAEIIAV